MSRKCIISGKGPLVGNNVSHANNKTKRRFLPNMQSVSFYSHILDRKFKLKLSASAIRTIDFKGGLDGFLSSRNYKNLPVEFRKIKKAIGEVN